MPYTHKNFAYSTVLTAPSPPISGTSLGVQVGDGANFPSVGWVVIWPTAAQPLVTNAEVCFFIATGDTFALIRAGQGSTARTIQVGDQISAPLTVADMRVVEGYLTADSVFEYLGPLYYKIVTYEFDVPLNSTLEIDSGGFLEII